MNEYSQTYVDALDAQWKIICAAKDAECQELRAEHDEMKANYLDACQTIAAMHAAATGKPDDGPRRGVVEDVEDLRAEKERLQARIIELEQEPDWSKAPAWAQFWAMDGDCTPCWYEVEPSPVSSFNEWNGLGGQVAIDNADRGFDWRKTLRCRSPKSVVLSQEQSPAAALNVLSSA